MKKAGLNRRPRPSMDEVKEINRGYQGLEAEASEHETWVREFLLTLPNLPHA